MAKMPALVKLARRGKRFYTSPEDIEKALDTGVPLSQVKDEFLCFLAGVYADKYEMGGAEDQRCCAFVLTKER